MRQIPVGHKAICSHMFCERYLSDYFSREKRSLSSPCYEFFVIFNRLCKTTLWYDKALWFYVFISSSIFLVLEEQGTRGIFSQRINPVLLRRKILSHTQELRKFVFHAFLTFENTWFNKLICRGRLTIFLDITGRRDEISGILFAHTCYLHSKMSHGVELSTNFEECVCFVRVWEKEKKREKDHIHIHTVWQLYLLVHITSWSKTDHPPPFETPKL